MIFGKHKWVCSICGQGITRKSSAIRHNDNLHHVDTKIVRPYDYIIGRLNGEFPPPIDPLLYRHNKKGKKDTLDPIYYHDDDNNNNKSGFKTVPDSDELRCENRRQQPVNYNTNKRLAHLQPDSPILQPQHKPIQGKYYDSLEKLSERRLKLRVQNIAE